MHWILQKNLFNEAGWDRLVETLERFKISYSVHAVIPFVGELEPDINPDGKVICFGAYSLRHLAQKRGWNPGVYDLAPYTFEEQRKHWGKLMLNYDSEVVRFADAKFEGVRFVRPIDDTKSFAGRLFDDMEFTQWQADVSKLTPEDGSTITADTLIQLSSPKKIYSEYRCWVVRGEIVTMSQYKLGSRVVYQNMDNLTLSRDARMFANEVLATKNRRQDITCACGPKDGWHPLPAFCLDVCETPDGWRVVEINTINSSGFYAANMTELVNHLEWANR